MARFLVVCVLLVIAFNAKVKATCNCSATALPATCRCNGVMFLGQQMLSIDCRHVGLLNLSFLTLLSEEDKRCVERLDVSGNAIEQVDRTILSNLTYLRDLSLADNRLNSLAQDVFINLPSLERLNLSDNSIVNLPSNTFGTLSNMKELILSRMNLTSFPDLQNISADLTILHLNDNKIATIDEVNFKPLEGTNNWIDIDLSGNPLVCDCHLAWIVDWFVRHPLVRMAFNLTCGSSVIEVAGQHVTLLQEDKLLCDQNECMENNAACEHVCKNTYGGYECGCMSGYMLFNQSRCGFPPNASVAVVSTDTLHFVIGLPEMRTQRVVFSGGNVTLTCKVNGVPTPSVRWQFKDNIIGFDYELQIRDVQLSAAGKYNCLVENQLGDTIETIDLEVWPESSTVPRETSCSAIHKATLKGAFELPEHSGVEKYVLQPCIEGPLCGVSGSNVMGHFKCSNGMWQVIDVDMCQYADQATRDLQCLSVHSVNRSNAEWVAKKLQGLTSNQNMNYLQINFAIDTLESILAHSALLSFKMIEHIVYSLSQLMAAPALVLGSTPQDYSNRLSSLIHRIAHTEIEYPDSNYMLFVDSPLLYYEVASAGSQDQLVFNRSTQTSVTFSGAFTVVDLESSSSGAFASGQNYVSLPANTGYMARYKTNALFQDGVVDLQDTCRLDDCRTQWKDMVVNAPILSVGTGRSGGNNSQTSVIQLAFQPLQNGVDPLCVHWDYAANGSGGWSCTHCALKAWYNNMATCQCTLESATYTVLMTNCNTSHSDRCKCSGTKRGTLVDIGVISCYVTIAAISLSLIILFLSWLKSDEASLQCYVKFNIVVALLCAAVMYIVSMSPNQHEFLNNATCKAVASLLHYFLIALFLWLAVDAYVALTTSLYPNSNNKGSRRCGNLFINASIFCWGIPLIVVLVCHIIEAAVSEADCYLYGATVQIDPMITNGEEKAQICWIKSYYIVMGVLAVPAVVLVVFSVAVYCYLFSKTARGMKRLPFISSLIIVILIALTWTFGLMTLTNHNEFSDSVCDSFSLFYYFFGVCQSATAVTVIVSLWFIAEVKQGVKGVFMYMSSGDHMSSASEEKSDVLSFSSGLPQTGDRPKKGKQKGLRHQSSSGYVKSGDQIPLETLVSLMPFSMDLRQHQVAIPAVRASTATMDTDRATVTGVTRSMGEGQSQGSSWKDENKEEGKFVDLESDDSMEKDRTEKQGEEMEKNYKLIYRMAGTEGEETRKEAFTMLDEYETDSNQDRSDSFVKIQTPEIDPKFNLSVTQTKLEFRDDGVFSIEINDPPTPLPKRLQTEESSNNKSASTTNSVISPDNLKLDLVPKQETVTVTGIAVEQETSKTVGRKYDEDGQAKEEIEFEDSESDNHAESDDVESERADKVGNLLSPQDSLARNMRELDDMLSISQASLQEFEESIQQDKLSTHTPFRPSRATQVPIIPGYTPHYVGHTAMYPSSSRRDRSVRKLLIPSKSDVVHRNEHRVIGSQAPMIVTEVRQPRRMQPQELRLPSHPRYEHEMMGRRHVVPYPEMYQAHQRGRPQAYHPRSHSYSQERHDKYRYYHRPAHYSSHYAYAVRPRPRPQSYSEDKYTERPPHSRRYYQASSPSMAYGYPVYPQRQPPRPDRLLVTRPPEFQDGRMLPPHYLDRPVARPRTGYRRNEMDQLFFFPGTAQEIKTMNEALLGEDDESALDAWYDDH